MISTTESVDRKWGWEFGEDGLMTPDEACDLIGCGRTKLDQLLADRVLRKGKDPNFNPNSKGTRVKICRRSVREYIRSMEV